MVTATRTLCTGRLASRSAAFKLALLQVLSLKISLQILRSESPPGAGVELRRRNAVAVHIGARLF